MPDVTTDRSAALGSPRRARRLALPAALAAWAGVTALAFTWLCTYAATPGPAHAAPPSVAPTPDRNYSLLLFLHPQCPCSRATLTELARLTARTQGRLTTRVLFILPATAGGDWRHTSLYDTARAIPGVIVDVDPGGQLAKRYGAATSGHAVLYAPDGSLAFTGGITASRAHEGDNAGESAILSLVTGQPAATRHTPVFGCTLFDDGYDSDTNSPPSGKAQP